MRQWLADGPGGALRSAQFGRARRRVVGIAVLGAAAIVEARIAQIQHAKQASPSNPRRWRAEMLVEQSGRQHVVERGEGQLFRGRGLAVHAVPAEQVVWPDYVGEFLTRRLAGLFASGVGEQIAGGIPARIVRRANWISAKKSRIGH